MRIPRSVIPAQDPVVVDLAEHADRVVHLEDQQRANLLAEAAE
ncbi:hypothetical protein GCM10025868_20100 [Angustibacter aerolatus]|uniref:Uncharacterized protein n=1 Tax=Angustibacter aerolatus TaxID=1162965 RepID=A0ABQ6JEZ9_9ACTN|nr:hypothetical protein GCM10025868_20100 [Angustibacter aerolatus]